MIICDFLKLYWVYHIIVWEGYKGEKGTVLVSEGWRRSRYIAGGEKKSFRDLKLALFAAKTFRIECANCSLPGATQDRGKNYTLIAHLIYSNSIKENDLLLVSSCFDYFYSFWFTCEQLSGYLIGQYKVTELLFFMNNLFIPWTVIL